MDHTMQTTWETYVASWKATTAAEKQALFVASLDEHCTYTDPLGVASGWEALKETMQGFHQQLPGAYFVTERFMGHHQHCMAQWKMVGADGAKLGEGISFGQFNGQGKLLAMTGFYETA